VSRPAIYSELASWYPLLTTPEDYDEEAAFILQLLREHGEGPKQTLLELGAGAGHLASHLKSNWQAVLTDLSPEMLALSVALNPDCEHHVGDMRTLRLERTFDAVLAHDAISYMTTEEELRAALTTAFVHLRPGGVALFLPDHVRETFEPATDQGGTDQPDRALRYLEWSTDPDPDDTTCVVDYAWMLRESDGSMRVFADRLIEGLFPRQTWLDLLAQTGFLAHASQDPWGRVPFLGVRPER
jgi:SAM-dependent methyltransferase